MESKALADKLPLDDSGNIDMEEEEKPPAAESSDARPTGRVTGKRSSRSADEPAAGEPRPHSARGFDMAKASSLGRELLERKRLMLGQVTLSSSLMRGDGDAATPTLSRLAEVKVSDEESDDGGPKNAKKVNRNATPSRETRVKSEPLSEEDIQKRKAQRRREQVRAASRRCRDRQRRETEELRMKVFQLEEFISHTMQSYESELRHQRHQFEAVQRENESLRAKVVAMHSDQISSAASVASSSASVTSSPGRSGYSETSTSPSASGGGDDIIWDTTRIQNMHATIETAKRAVLRILDSTAPPALQHHAFGWHFDFWAEQSEYFVRSYKFYRGMRAHDVADRNFDVDFVKYLETFPEIKSKRVLQWPSPNVRIVQTVKDFPGRGSVSSLAAIFISRDDYFNGPGERWLVGSISVGSSNALTFSYEDDCNGYIFEDAIEVTSDGHEVHGCMVRGIGRFDSNGQDVMSLMKELAKIFASVVIRWEALFINDYMDDADASVDDLDGLGF